MMTNGAIVAVVIGLACLLDYRAALWAMDYGKRHNMPTVVKTANSCAWQDVVVGGLCLAYLLAYTLTA